MEPHDLERLCNGVQSKSGFESKTRNELCSSSSLVLDSEKDELVEATFSSTRNGVSSSDRRIEALRNHSEAETKRRARINAHLDTLRSLVPGAQTMDKASLLGEVITHIEELKRTAAEASEGLLVPMDIDELKVEAEDNRLESDPYSIRVSFSCDYKPGLLSDLQRALNALHLIVMKAEIATLEGRMKNVFLMTRRKEMNNESAEVHQVLASSVHQAIRTILDKFSASYEFSLKSTFSHKRRRVSLFDPSFSSSSSSGDVW